MSTFTNPGGTKDGVVGTTASHNHNGVIGRNDDTTARNAPTPEGNGVFGTTRVPDGAGLFGLPENNRAGDGVQGITNSEFRNGVYGRNEATNSRGNSDPTGNGVLGFTDVPDGSGVLGVNGRGGHGVDGSGGFGVTGLGTIIAVWGIAKS